MFSCKTYSFRHYISEEISTYLVNVKKLGYSDKPNYNQLRDIFTKGLSKLGIKDTWKLALPLAGAAKPSTSSPKVSQIDIYLWLTSIIPNLKAPV